ncbi:MAG: putative tricarboxylic transport rane protein [Clostridia bacterium]|nr:putative tricarboxylic transport rane protein [Clostridia bacterium]
MLKLVSKKNGGFLLILVLGLALILAGCNSGSADKAENNADKPKTEEKQEQAVEFPTKKLTIVIPYGSGGGTDQVARMLAGIMKDDFGKPIICVNKTGGGGAVGLQYTADAEPDGHTIVLTTSNISTVKITGNSELTYKDFEPIIGVNFDSPALVVRSDSPWKTAEEFIAYAKENKVSIGTGSPGGLWHVGVIKLQKETEAKFNIVPSTTGGAKASVRLMGGHVDAIAIPPNEAMNGLESGEFRMLATMTPERVEAFPDIPTFKDLGYDVNIRSVRGFLAPKGTPSEIIKILHDKIKKAVEDQRYVDFIQKKASNIFYMNTAEYKKYLDQELKDYTQLIKDAGLAKE